MIIVHDERAYLADLVVDDEEQYTDVKCEAVVDINTAYIVKDDIIVDYRPYLVLQGEVNAIKIIDRNIELQFAKNGIKPSVHYRYEFDNQQLADLVNKGLYDKGFAVPIRVSNNEYELPISCNIRHIKDMQMPILFVSINNQYDMTVDAATSGYTLSQYFDKIEHFDKVDDMMYDDLRTLINADDIGTMLMPEIDDVVYDDVVFDEPVVEEVSDDVKKVNKVVLSIDQYVSDKMEENKHSDGYAVEDASVDNMYDIIKRNSIEAVHNKAIQDANKGNDVKPIVFDKSGSVKYGDTDAYDEYDVNEMRKAHLSDIPDDTDDGYMDDDFSTLI